MAKLRVFFVRCDITSPIDNTIAIVSKGKWVHTAIEIIGGTLEALDEPGEDLNGNPIESGVRLSPLGKYDGRADVLIKLIDVPDPDGSEETARNLIGVPYGHIDCVEGGLHDQTGIELPDNGLLTANCSKTVVLVLRAGKVVIDGGTPAGDITPMDLLKALGGE
ncbi:MAG: hypothetical protein P4N59_07500 [Negativicutes bacterium]|nr:hypothetical protein [Negativicutes bacterium]